MSFASRPVLRFQVLCDLGRNKFNFETNVPISRLSRVRAKIRNRVRDSRSCSVQIVSRKSKHTFLKIISRMLSRIKFLNSRFTCFGLNPSLENTNILCYCEFTGDFVIKTIILGSFFHRLPKRRSGRY